MASVTRTCGCERSAVQLAHLFGGGAVLGLFGLMRGSHRGEVSRLGLGVFLNRLRKDVVSFGFATAGAKLSVELTFSAFSLASSCFARHSSFSFATYWACEPARFCIACGTA